MSYTVILFPSSSYALYARKVLEMKKLKVKLIPVPRLLSSNCGVCIRIDSACRESAESLLEEKGIDCEGFHLL